MSVRLPVLSSAPCYRHHAALENDKEAPRGASACNARARRRAGQSLAGHERYRFSLPCSPPSPKTNATHATEGENLACNNLPSKTAAHVSLVCCRLVMSRHVATTSHPTSATNLLPLLLAFRRPCLLILLSFRLAIIACACVGRNGGVLSDRRRFRACIWFQRGVRRAHVVRTCWCSARKHASVL